MKPEWKGSLVVVWAMVDLGFHVFASEPLVLGRLDAGRGLRRGAGRRWRVGRLLSSLRRDKTPPPAPIDRRSSRAGEDSVEPSQRGRSSVSTIHQIYCTHCTHGTSGSFSAAEGRLADRMLGYSARAGSLEARELRYYRQIEQHAYYYLPRHAQRGETSPDGLDGACRLVFHPSAGGLQVIGQICYRQTDTEAGPARTSPTSSFAKRTTEDAPGRSSTASSSGRRSAGSRKTPPTTRSCFNPSPRSTRCSPDAARPSTTTSSSASSTRRQAGRSTVRRARSPTGGGAWTPRRAAGLFTEAFRGFLEMGSARGESLLLVIEPSVAAALVFYGAPSGCFPSARSALISFSTFEPNADRVGASLAATAFCDPQKTDLRRRLPLTAGSPSTPSPGAGRRAGGRGHARRPWSGGCWSRGGRRSTGLWPVSPRREHAACEDLDALAAVESLVPAAVDPSQTRFDDTLAAVAHGDQLPSADTRPKRQADWATRPLRWSPLSAGPRT